MKIIDCVQGTAEWYRARLGIPTASQFHRIVTPGGKLSAQAGGYTYRLLAERLLNQPMDTAAATEWMDRGQELEPKAVRQYEFAEDVTTRKVGFVTTDDGTIGASPDRLIQGVPRAVEIKCPAPQTHIAYLLDGPGTDYRPQVQGQILVADLESVDLYSFHPRMPPALIRSVRDEQYIRLLRASLDEFLSRLHEMEHRARALGVFQPHVDLMTPAEFEAAQANLRQPDWAQDL